MNDLPQPSDNVSPRKGWTTWFSQTEIPLTVYATIFSTMAFIWVFQDHLPELLAGLFTELLGAAFTLFIIDTLLVRSKTKRWKLVQENIDYLIARNVYRLRDGLSARAFGFQPRFESEVSEEGKFKRMREQRADLLENMEELLPEELIKHFSEATLFSENTYSYLNEKAADLWDILNMKYAEYLPPELVSSLIRLHTHVKDASSHLRQYAKAERFPAESDYYHRIGRQGMSLSVLEILKIVNALKLQGYSEPANASQSPPSGAC
jgi:hypothetical protein